MRELFVSWFFLVSAFVCASAYSDEADCKFAISNPLQGHSRGCHDRRSTTASPGRSFVCPAIYGRYPHEKDCALYYECRFGYPHLMRCSRDKLYDDIKEQCNDKRRVNCNRKDKNKDRDDGRDQKELDHDESFKCPYIWGTFAHPTECSKYYVCVYNIPALFQCYGSTLFDTKSRKCLDKRRVKCEDRLDRDDLKTSRRPTSYRTTTARYGSTTARYRSTTARYGSTTARYRSTTARYGSTTARYRSTTARYGSTTVTVPTTTTKDSRKFACPFVYGRYPDPEECSQFYECRFSIPVLHKCPKSTLYDERKEECREDSQVRCGDRPGGVDGDDSKEDKKKEKLRCPYVWGTFPHPDDCSKYIICMYNVPTVFSCTKSDLFHAKYRRCIPKEKVTCDYRINPDDLEKPDRKTTRRISSTLTQTIRTSPVTLPTTTEAPTTTAAPTTTEAPTTTAIPSTFSPSTKVTKPNTPPPTDCDEDDLDCIIDTTGDVKGWFDCPERYGHFAHGSSHQLFIHCDNFRPFVKKCADHTVFSPKYLVCMWM